MKSLQLLTLCFMMVVCLPSFATTINVPGDTTSIKGGIALASSGDTVLVAPGIYYEYNIYINKNIILSSYFLTTGDTTFINSTIVDGNAQGKVFLVDNVLKISGFTIRNGQCNGYAGGIWVRGDTNGSPIIANNIITGNQSIGHRGGGGIETWLGHTIIRNNKIINNHSAGAGGGIFVSSYGQATISDNIISNNTAGTNGGGIACEDTVGSLIMNNLISDNSSSGYGGGIYCNYDANPVIKENTIIGNLSLFGSAIECMKNSNPEITNNIIADHSVIFTIQLINCSPLLRNNTFYNNSSGIILDCSNSDASIINNLMVSNTGNAINSYGSNLTIANNDFFNHKGDLFSGDIPSGIGVISQTNANGDSCDAYANIFLDPLLADTANGDFQITWANWPVGDSAGLSLILYNTGLDTLEIINISNSQSVFSHNWNPGNSQILPGDSLILTLTFTPADTNSVLDTLRLANNDKPLEVVLSGKGESAVGITNPRAGIYQNGMLVPVAVVFIILVYKQENIRK